MPSGFGKPLRLSTTKCFVSSNRATAELGMKLASPPNGQSKEGPVMNAVISIETAPRPGTSYVRCPSCQVKVHKVHEVVARMSWDRFRCKCGYDGPLEYIASIGKVKRKASGT